MSELKLSVCIATLNRGSLIGATLESIISQATEQVEIVILDGASTDNTESVVCGRQKHFPRLRYIRQSTNMGVDHDFAEAVAMARGEYCWLFSDDDILKPGAIQAVLTAIDCSYGLIIVNAEVRSPDLSKVLEPKRIQTATDKVYKPAESELLLTELGDYLTFIGCVIINRQLWNDREKERYFGSYFMHAGVIFQARLTQDTLLIANPLIAIRYGNAMWHGNYFEIWMFKWPNLIWSFDGFPDTVKLRVCPREPWRRIRRLLLFRARGAYTINKYLDWLEPRLESFWTRAASKAIAYLPIRIANLLCVIYCSLSGRGSRRPLTLVDLTSGPFCFWRFRGSRSSTNAARPI